MHTSIYACMCFVLHYGPLSQVDHLLYSARETALCFKSSGVKKKSCRYVVRYRIELDLGGNMMDLSRQVLNVTSLKL